jgi:hypothetical protein
MVGGTGAIEQPFHKANPSRNKKLKGFGALDSINSGLAITSSVIDILDDRAKQKRFDEWRRTMALPDNSMIAKSVDRGDWDINTGIFRPNKIGFKSKGMYTNNFDYRAPGNAAYGGSINNSSMEKIKIRITGGVEKMATGGQPMTYSGQLGYGINLGQKRIYTDMPPEKTETINKTIQPVPREQANIEAEKGETVFGDIDGDGAMEHMLIGGKKHTEGGTPLNVPEGSFIFSDTKELIIKDSKILEKFKMPANKKGYTPAEIAKKYDTTKYKAIIEDKNSDSIKKATAQIMVKTFERKLAELTLIQEQMKGFPQGIPEVAKKYFPELKTKEDQQMEPGASENIQFGQQLPQEEMSEGMQEQPPMGMQMEFGGMIPRFDLAGQVGSLDTPPYNTDFINQVGMSGFDPSSTWDPGPDDPNASSQTYTKARTPLTDAQFTRFKELLEKYDTKKYGKKAYYINSLTPEEAAEFAHLATIFGFKRDAESNIPGYRIIQGATPDYTFAVGKGKKAKNIGFFGGFTPEMYERRVVESELVKDASDKMTDVERRKKYFEILGVDASGIPEAKLANPKLLYKDQDFFLKKFYPSFTKVFKKEGFRPEMQDDMLIGAEHYDSYQLKQQPPADQTTIGYKCTGRDPNTKKPNIVSSSYVSNDAMVKDGAVSSETEALKQCPEKFDPGQFKPTAKDTTPFGYTTPDKVSMLAAAAGFPKKYLPWAKQVPFEPGEVVFKDWRAKAAERQSLMNRMASQLGTYAPGTSMASNLSFLAGQQGEGLIKDIDDVDAYNVQVANAFTDKERQRKDQINILNTAKAEELYKGNVIANQQYDNAKRQYLNNLAKSYGNAWKNRMYLGLLNSVNPMFNISPASGRSYFKQGYDENQLGNLVFGNSTGTAAQTFQDRVAENIKRGYPKELAEKAAYEDEKRLKQSSVGTSNRLGARSMLPMYSTLGFGFNPDEDS